MEFQELWKCWFLLKCLLVCSCKMHAQIVCSRGLNKIISTLLSHTDHNSKETALFSTANYGADLFIYFQQRQYVSVFIPKQKLI